MGRAIWIITFALILFVAGCLEATNVKVDNLCCAKVEDGECVELANNTGDDLASGYEVVVGGNCSTLSRVCYQVEIKVPSGEKGNATIPLCKYALEDNCDISYTYLSYQKFYPKKEVNYDAAIQLFMFNNSTTTDYTPIPDKSPIKLLYAKPYLDVLPSLDLRRVNIYGIKFGVGRSFKQFYQYRNFFPFDYSYVGQNLYNPYFYVLSNKSVDICEYDPAGNNYTCGNRSFRTFESCLLFCEMPDYSRPSIYDLNVFDLYVNRSLGYSTFYRNLTFYEKTSSGLKPVDEDFSGITLKNVILQHSALANFFNRYEVGLFKVFADEPTPNFFESFNDADKLTVKASQAGLFGKLLSFELFRFGCRTWVTLEDAEKDPYNITVINSSIVTYPLSTDQLKDIDLDKGTIASLRDTKGKYYRIEYNSTIQLTLDAKVKSECCIIACWTTGVKYYKPLYIIYNNSVNEIIAEEKQPLTYISQILPYAYYFRYFPNTSIHHKFPRMKPNGEFENFTGLPYECLADKNIQYCDNTYYERYACIDKDTGEDIECGCTSEGCYALNPTYMYLNSGFLGAMGIIDYIRVKDPYYQKYYVLPYQKMPTLKFQDGWKAEPSLNLTDTENWTRYDEISATQSLNEREGTWKMEYFSFPSRNVETPYGKAIAIPQQYYEHYKCGWFGCLFSKRGTFQWSYHPEDGRDLKIMGCFENYSGSDSVILCRSGSKALSTVGTTTKGGPIVGGEYILLPAILQDTFSPGVKITGSLSASEFCNAILSDPELFNKSFVRNPFHMNDTAYFFSVAFAVDVDGDGAIGRCNLSVNDKGDWGIAVRSYGLPKVGMGYLTSAAQLITWSPTFTYSGSERDDVVPAKHACGHPDVNYRTIAYDDYRRTKGCYSGVVVNKTKVKGPALTEDKQLLFNYSYGFWKHLPNTEQVLKNLLLEGVQPILFIDDEIWNGDDTTLAGTTVKKREYLTKLLRDLDNFILVDAAIVYPFIQYTDFPIGAVIVVAPDETNREYVENVCQTCFAVTPINFEISPSSASFDSKYNPKKDVYCSRPRLKLYTCDGVTPASCGGDWTEQDILFFNTSFAGINSLSQAYGAIERMLDALDLSVKYSGKPAYLYISKVEPKSGAKYLMMAMSNLSTNLSAVGVMGVHFEDFDEYLETPGSVVYEANELGRALRAANIKSVQEVEVNKSQCAYIVTEEEAPLTCINNTYPVLRTAGSTPLETENLVINSRNFLQNSYKIALANLLSGRYICNTAPDPETGETVYYTFLPVITYFKGAMPVLYHEVYGEKNAFPLQPYRYSKLNAIQCAPQDCRFEVRTVCEPATCYMLKESIHKKGKVSIVPNLQQVIERTGWSDNDCLWTELNPGNPEDKCGYSGGPMVSAVTIEGYGTFTYPYDKPTAIFDEDKPPIPPRTYPSASYGNYTITNILADNCTGMTDLTLLSNTTLDTKNSLYSLSLVGTICEQGTLSGWSSDCYCKPVKYEESNSVFGYAYVRDDYCKWKKKGSNWQIVPVERTRKVTFPRIVTTYIKFNETYKGEYCYDQVYLDCS